MSVVSLQSRLKKHRYVVYWIHLPKKIVENVLGWKKGDQLMVEVKTIDGKTGLFITRVEEKGGEHGS